MSFMTFDDGGKDGANKNGTMHFSNDVMAAAMYPFTVWWSAWQMGTSFWFESTRRLMDPNVKGLAPEAPPKDGAVHHPTILDVPMMAAGMPFVATALEQAPAMVQPKGMAAARDGKPDELQLISGIGPKIEATLHGLGIFHFDQIADWSEDELQWVDHYLNFKGRAVREDWQQQAEALALGGREEYARRFGKEPR